MAEQRRLTDLVHGHVGSLTYVPRGHTDEGPGILHSSRITSGAPHFQVIGSSAELYPPSKSHIPEGSSRLWQERRTQKRWLLKSHPEAFMGSIPLDGFLEESMDRFHKVEGETADRPLLAMGQMTSVRDLSRVGSLPILAVATGESGELLRLVRIDESKWQWGDGKDVSLNLSVIDPEDQEEEVIWANDGLPISQIKFATRLSRYEPIRWLLVQKQTSTTILQPEYHKVPVARKTTNDFFAVRRPSRIDPNPVLTLSHKDTGGNAHVDVAFNPPAHGQAPQIAIMDECGYWSIWNIRQTRRSGSSMNLSIDKCGHIQEGLLRELPPFPMFAAEKHGLLFVGTADTDRFWESETDETEAELSAVRSRYLLLWSCQKFDVVDLVSNITRPGLAQFLASKQKRERILDIQLSPVNPNHIFVLTTRHLFWVDLFGPSQEEGKSKPTMLIAAPHVIPAEDLRLANCRASEDKSTALVSVYSSRNRQLRVFWFGLCKSTGLPQWHRQVITLPASGNQGWPTDIHSLTFHHAKLIYGASGSAKGLGSKYKEQGLEFYQGSILGKDLSVTYCICAASLEQGMQVRLPDSRVGRSRSDQNQKWKRKRRQFIRHMGNSFVLPDGMTEKELESLVRRNPRSKGGLALTEGEKAQGPMPVVLKLDDISRRLRSLLIKSIIGAEVGLPLELLPAVREAIDKGMANGRLPLTTWQEIARHLGSAAKYEATEDIVENDMLRLFDKADDQVVIAQLRRRAPGEPPASLVGYSSLVRKYSQLWVEPLSEKLSNSAQRVRQLWVAELARDVLLSSYGILVQDTPLLGVDAAEDAQGNRTAFPSSAAIKSSQSSTPAIPSSPAAVEVPDAAIQRLQLLAPSTGLGKMSGAKRSSVLSYWPSQRGVDTSDYISSVAIDSDRQFDEARQRLQRIEKRRRTQAERYKLPPLMRQGSGSGTERRERAAVEPQAMPAQAMSSQQRVAESSQIQGPLGPSVTMSQPVAGTFGDRKRARKSKRKSGFR